MYQWILYLHIISVVVATGPVMIYVPLINKMDKLDEQQMKVFVDTFRSIVWGIKHAGHVLVTTGLLLMWLGGWPFKTSWIIAALVIIMAALFFLARAFSPILTKLETEHNQRKMLLKKLTNASLAYTVIMLLVLLLMVLKPTLW